MLGLLVALNLLMPQDGPGYRGRIRGQLRDVETLDPIVGAIVFLTCRCLSSERITKSDAQGWYTFDGLPAGRYHVDVAYDETWSTKFVELLPETTIRPPAYWHRKN